MRFLVLIFLIFNFAAIAQPPCTAPGGTPESGIAVCGALVFTQNVLPNCTAANIPQGNITCGGTPTGAIGAGNSIWYKFHCYQTGTLGFRISPLSPTADYDWSLMDVTGRALTDIATINLSISSNQSQNSGPTGCTPMGTDDFECFGTILNQQFNRMPTITVGRDYLLLITKFTTGGTEGYDLEFFGGTAVLTNPLPPSITSVASVACNPSQIKLTFSEDILCNSITTLASEFSIISGTNIITGITSTCTSGTNSITELIINLQNPLAAGNYQLLVGNGTDGNTLLDICNDPMLPVSIPFSINTSPAAPTVSSPLNLCQGATTAALTATGSNLLWYTTATGGTGSAIAPIPSSTALGNTTFSVSQTIGGCQSPRAAITVVVNPVPAQPIVNAGTTLPIHYCQGSTATALPVNNAPGILWFTTATGGVGSAITPTPSTTGLGSTFYYVSQTTNTCESARLPIEVIIDAIPSAPTVTTPINYCQNTTSSTLSATGTNLLWYTNATGGTGSAIAPTPSTSSNGNTNFYVSQTVNNCESPRAIIVVNVAPTPTAPLLTSPINYCQNTTAILLTATGANLLWYTTATGGTGSNVAPTPATTLVSNTTYYVSQNNGSCEGPRAAIVVNISPTPLTPTVSSPISFCQGTTSSSLTAIGTNLLWYTSLLGGTGNSTAPIPSTTATGNTSYFVSSTIGICEGARAEIVVQVFAIPSAPIITTPVVYCTGDIANALTATGTNLLWYTTATSVTGSAIAPIPNTTSIGNTSYFVSQTNGICEGARAQIIVSVNTTPTIPIVTTPIFYCENATTNTLTATGTNLQWYSTAIGGIASTTAPLPSSSTAGVFTYYVAQKLGNCESQRAAIVVNITATPTAPIVTSPQNTCPNNIVPPLTAAGTNLLWYTNSVGGVGSTNAPIPNTTISPATYIYYVSQSTAVGGCEGPRATIIFNVSNFLTINIGADTTICERSSVKFLPIATPAATLYEWRVKGSTLTNTIDNVTIKDATLNPTDTTEYILKAILSSCTKEDTVKVNVIWKPIINAGLSKAICLDSSTLLQAIVTRNSNDSINYNWAPIDSLATPTALQTIAKPTNTTLYTINYKTKSTYGCDFTGSSNIKLIVQKVDKAFAGNDTIAVKGMPHQLYGSGGLHYNWLSPSGISISNSFSQKAFVTLTNDAVFYLKVTDAIGCEGRDTIFIKTYNGPTYFVPNSFTPNGDGLNDVFRAIPVGMSNTTYLSVFNRLGELMFQTNQFLKGWDGTFKGKPQPLSLIHI